MYLCTVCISLYRSEQYISPYMHTISLYLILINLSYHCLYLSFGAIYISLTLHTLYLYICISLYRLEQYISLTCTINVSLHTHSLYRCSVGISHLLLNCISPSPSPLFLSIYLPPSSPGPASSNRNIRV